MIMIVLMDMAVMEWKSNACKFAELTLTVSLMKRVQDWQIFAIQSARLIQIVNLHMGATKSHNCVQRDVIPNPSAQETHFAKSANSKYINANLEL